MTPKELTMQAFELYDTIRVQSYRISEYSDHRKRLLTLEFRAFGRYKRRLKVEQSQDYLSIASRWGF
jgi:hypothetical protein